MDYVLISNSADIEKAIYARVEKIPVFIGGKMISGGEIKEICPDVHSYTGWYRTYEPKDAFDMEQIERDVPPETYKILEICQERVQKFLELGAPEKIGKEAIEPQKLLRLAGVGK